MSFSIRPYRRFLKPPLAYFSAFWSLITLMVLSSGPAYAEWVLINIAGDGTTIYVDPATIRRKGEMAKMWHLFDHKAIQTIGSRSFWSIKGQDQYDCAEERTRILVITWFSSKMGKGHVVFDISDEQKWESVAPDSIDEALWAFACGKQ